MEKFFEWFQQLGIEFQIIFVLLFLVGFVIWFLTYYSLFLSSLWDVEWKGNSFVVFLKKLNCLFSGAVISIFWPICLCGFIFIGLGAETCKM